jgi:hypothetical protein
VRPRAGRSRTRRVVAVAGALLQTVASVQLAIGLAWFGMLLSHLPHEGSHALSSVRDGNHLDLVLSHDAPLETHDHGSDTHLHRNAADDHVVHLVSDEARDSRRAPVGDLATTVATSRPVIAPPRVARVQPTPPARPVPPLSRRSVVLRT